MVKFWLDDFQELLNLDNFKFSDTTSLFNVISIIVIIFSIYLTLKRKDIYCFGVGIIILNILIILNINITKMKSGFSNIEGVSGGNGEMYYPYSGISGSSGNTGGALSTTQVTGNLARELLNPQPPTFNSDKMTLIRNVVESPPGSGVYNKLIVNSFSNVYPGDIIRILDNLSPGMSETNIVDSANTTDNLNYITVKKNLSYQYQANQTTIYVVKSVEPQITVPPDPLLSIQTDQKNKIDLDLNVSLGKKNTLGRDFDRKDYNLSIWNKNYQFQGPPNGPLTCRFPSKNNPMGVINIEEYNESPVMYGSCNISNKDVRESMDSFVEENVSQRISDILFHKGNSQNRFMPMPVDTLPDRQDQFAHFCYTNPTNLINPKYASIFVNDPDKFKLVTRLANATGTENGG